jgi:hypothetical protein
MKHYRSETNLNNNLVSNYSKLLNPQLKNSVMK